MPELKRDDMKAELIRRGRTADELVKLSNAALEALLDEPLNLADLTQSLFRIACDECAKAMREYVIPDAPPWYPLRSDPPWCKPELKRYGAQFIFSTEDMKLARIDMLLMRAKDMGRRAGQFPITLARQLTGYADESWEECAKRCVKFGDWTPRLSVTAEPNEPGAEWDRLVLRMELVGVAVGFMP